MPSWMEGAGPSTTPAERRPLILSLRIPRSYGSLFPYYKFVRDTACESYRHEVLLYLINFYHNDLRITNSEYKVNHLPALSTLNVDKCKYKFCSKIYHH